MPNKDKNNKNNPKPSKFNKKAFKHAIGMIESSGGKFLETGINPNTGKRWSSAAGKYHFLYSAIKNDPSMDGVSKREFMNRPELQESIMDKALDGSLKDYTYGEKYARKLKGEFGSDMDVNDLTAMVHFIGAGNVRKYLKDPDNFKVPGGQNMTVDGYVKKFRGYFDKNMLDQGFVKEPKTLLDPSPKREVPSNIPNERNIPRAQDNTNANSMNDLMSKLSQNESSFTNKQESNSFKGGGQMSAQSGADALVTLFEGGGSHEDNPLGGIPQGVGANGKTNLVEEGETKWNDYIFSNSFDMGGNFTGEDGKKSNVFAEGGSLNSLIDPVKKPKIPVVETTPAFGPQENEGSKYPLQYTKTQSAQHTKGLDTEVHDIRANYMNQPNSFSTNQKEGVDFDSLANTFGAKEFLKRYNDPVTRGRLKEQAGLSDYDIDNHLLAGLTANYDNHNSNSDAKATYDEKTNNISVSPKFKNTPGVETHERAHASKFDQAMAGELQSVLGNSFHQEGKNHLENVKRYLNQPHETYGNFSEFREKIGLKPGEQINEKELLKRVKTNDLYNSNFFMTFENKKILKALNTVAFEDNNQQTEYKLS